MTNANLASELQKLAPSAIIELFEIDLTIFGDEIYRFHGGTNELKQPIVFDGETYQPWAIEASGFDFNTKGQLPRPRLALSNVAGAITAFILSYNDCLGAKVTRKITLKKFLDAENFESEENPSADPTAYLDYVYFIDRKATEDKNTVEFELTAAFDVTGVKLPRRQVTHLCPFLYRGTECGYAGTDYFKADDTPTASSTLDVCGKRLSSCKARFGANAGLPFGGFPGAGRTT